MISPSRSFSNLSSATPSLLANFNQDIDSGVYSPPQSELGRNSRDQVNDSWRIRDMQMVDSHGDEVNFRMTEKVETSV